MRDLFALVCLHFAVDGQQPDIRKHCSLLLPRVVGRFGRNRLDSPYMVEERKEKHFAIRASAARTSRVNCPISIAVLDPVSREAVPDNDGQVLTVEPHLWPPRRTQI